MGEPLILGIHYGHDASAALIRGTKILAAVTEGRFTGNKHNANFPIQSIMYCLKFANSDINNIDAIATTSDRPPREDVIPYFKYGSEAFKKYYEKIRPKSTIAETLYELSKIKIKILKFLLDLRQKNKIPHQNNCKSTIRFKEKTNLPTYLPFYEIDNKIPIYLIEHHLAHAASAYFTSGFKNDNLIITADGIGDKMSTVIWQAINGKITPLVRYGARGSLGWYYGVVTEGLGWWIGNGEGKTMGLAPYGDPNIARTELMKFLPIYKNGYLHRGYNFSRAKMFEINGTLHFHFQESRYIQWLLRKYKREDIAAAAQKHLEEQMLEIVSYWLNNLDVKQLCSAGGVFLNVKLNQVILDKLNINDYHIFPAAGDSGLAVGAALQASFEMNNKAKFNSINNDYFGPEFSNDEIESILEVRKLKYERNENIAEICGEELEKGKIVGWFQGKMELGPRALGNRSILIDPRYEKNKDIINNRVKYRDPWRPFCPSMLEDSASDYLLNSRSAPYMIISFDVPEAKIEEIPAVVHVDGTTRPQTVSRIVNPRYYRLIERFGELTSVPVILNTSFNIKGSPIVCQPKDAIECFFNTGMDILAMNDFIIRKE